jgi:long-chain fatty acid transport protein
MKKLTFFAALLMLAQLAFAGGLLTNTNQSAQFIRMMSRNASTGIDAVYFNPAGLIKMDNGFHLAVYNQTIFQTKPVETEFQLLNDPNYEGIVNVPVFPTAFAVYKMDNWAFSLGFGPNAGGGSATFDKGLPSFEIPLTKIAPGMAQLALLKPAGIDIDLPSGYDAKLYFDGSSVFWGIQLGASYRVNDILSVYGGVRYLPAKNNYQGSIKDIELDFNGQKDNAMEWMKEKVDIINSRSLYYSDLASQAAAGAVLFNGAATSLQPIVDGGGGSLTLVQLENAGFIEASIRAQLEAGLQAIGLTPEQISALDVSTIKTTFTAASTNLEDQAEQANGASTLLATAADGLDDTANKMGNKEVETEQTGAGFTPMIGINYSPFENLNIAVKYEMKTVLELTNNTKVDDLGLFPDGAKSRNDLPAILGVGIGYNAGVVETQLSYNMYFNKNVDWGMNIRDMSVWKEVDASQIRKREIDRNGMELALGLQFNVLDNFALSVGGLYGDMGIAESYQSDFSYSNPSTTAGAGFAWKITDALTLDAGVSNTFYQDQTVTFTDPDVGPYDEHLKKTTLNFAVGLSYSIF